MGSNIEVIQFHHRYSIVYPSLSTKTGEQYEWFDRDGKPSDIPNIADFAPLPEPWLEYMEVSSPEAHQGFHGTIEDWLNTLEPGEPSTPVRAFLATLKAPESHDDVVKITYRLIRLGAEREPGVGEAFETLWDSWVQSPYDTPDKVYELTTAIEGAIRKAGAPQNLTFEIALEKVTTPDIERLVFDSENPEDLPLLLDAIKDLSTSEQVVILEGSKIGKGQEPVKAKAPAPHPTKSSKILTEAERETLALTPNFIDTYRYVASLRDDEPNDPYYRLDAVATLSVVLGKYGALPAKEGTSPLNIWGLKAGKTTSGKGVSKTQFFQTCRVASLADFDAEVNYGSKTSGEALNEWLITHDGETTLFQTDEGHGWLKSLRNRNGYQTGLQEDFTNYYEGDVPAFHFKNSEHSGKTARTNFCLWIQGTPKSIIENLYPDQAESGFLVRFLVVFGNERVVRRRVDEEQGDTAEALGMSPYIWALGKGLQARAEDLDRSGGSGRFIRAPQEVRERLADAADALHGMYSDHRLKDLIQPNLLRQRRNIWKIAALLAMSEGRTTIAMTDMLLAIREWEDLYAPNAVVLLEAISENEFERQQTEVLKFIKGRPAGRATTVSVSRAFAGMERLDGVLDRLVRAGRITKEEGGNTWVAT